jgi:hypothetical protein
MRIQESVEIERTSEEVFVYATDPATWSEWVGSIIEVSQPIPSQRMQEGGNFMVIYTFLGRRVKVPHEVTAFDLHRRLSYRSMGGPIPHEESFVFEALPGGGARCTHIVRFKPSRLAKVIGPLLRRMASHQSRENLWTLKGLMEAREQPESTR